MKSGGPHFQGIKFGGCGRENGTTRRQLLFIHKINSPLAGPEVWALGDPWHTALNDTIEIAVDSGTVNTETRPDYSVTNVFPTQLIGPCCLFQMGNTSLDVGRDVGRVGDGRCLPFVQRLPRDYFTSLPFSASGRCLFVHDTAWTMHPLPAAKFHSGQQHTPADPSTFHILFPIYSRVKGLSKLGKILMREVLSFSRIIH